MDRCGQGTNVVSQLATLLRKSGEKILSGKSKLSLTTKCLVLLNGAFHNISDGEYNTSFEVVAGNSNRHPYWNDLQFLHDFVQKTFALKLLHGSSTVQGHLSLVTFRSLKSLEIKRTPLHLIEGLQKLRNKLEVIELFETCGGDLSSPMSWPDLHTANLAYNNIETLDASLRLVPALQLLDVSHNAIVSTDNYLEYLTELAVLNLGYNRLVKIPSVSISSKSKLRTLILRNNCLELISGMDEMVGLRELDLANNCLSDHSLLAPLGNLQWLHILILEDNPITYHRKHRLMTVGNLHPTALKRLMLDGKKVTPAEYELGKKRFGTLSTIRSRQSPTQSASVTSDSNIGYSGTDRSYEFTTTVEEESHRLSSGVEGESVRRKGGKGKGKSSRKARRADISDNTSPGEQSSDGESLSRTPILSSLSNIDHKNMRQEVENMREHLGPDWLQKLTLQRKQNDPQNRRVVANERETPEDDLYLKEKISKQPPDSNTKKQLSNRTVTKSNDHQTVSPLEISAPAQPSCSINTRSEDESPYNNFQTPNHEERSSEVSDKTRAKKLLRNTGNTESDQNDDQSTFWEHSNKDTPADYGPETEPYIVCMADNPEHQLLISISERYILEKDLNGELTETLDIKCLLYAKSKKAEDIAILGINAWVLELNFDYLKKDRRHRMYVMEQKDMEELMSMLNPVLEAKKYWAQMVDRLSCLKCAHEFGKSESSIKLKNLKKDSPVHSASQVDDKMFCCPSCGSDMVIELDATEVAKAKGSNYTTPIGSFASGHLSLTPLAQATPLKDVDNNQAGEAPYVVKSDDSLSTTSESTAASFKSCQTVYLSAVSSGSDLTLQSRASPRQRSATSRESLGMPRSVSGTMLQSLDESGGGREQSGVFRKNRSAQDLKKLSSGSSSSNRLGRLQSVESDIVVLERNESHGSGYTTGSDISVLTGSDITVCTNPSARASVTDSDILILENPSRKNSSVEGRPSPTSNDITILPTPVEEGTPASSENSSMMGTPVSVLDTEKTIKNGLLNAKVDDHLKPLAQAPAGDSPQDFNLSSSISSKTVNSLVSSVYENVLTEGDVTDNEPSIYGSVAEERTRSTFRPEWDATSFHSVSSGSGDISRINVSYNNSSHTKSLSPASGGTSDIKFSYDDYKQVDHRLKLYIDMQLLKEEAEEFSLVLKCGIVQYTKNEEFEGLLILSNTCIYILQIDKELCNTDEHVEKWLKPLYSQKIVEVKYVDFGVGHQSFHIESATEASSFTFLLRDDDRAKKFIKSFTSCIQASAFSSNSQLEAISKSTPSTLENLETQVLRHTDDSDEEVDTSVELFILGYLRTGAKDSTDCRSVIPVSLAATPTHLCLAKEDHRWPLPRMIDTDDPVNNSTQFELKDRQRITDITSVDIFDDILKFEFALNFLDEESGEECIWQLLMETRHSLKEFLGTISQLWENKFGVELQVNKLSI